MRERALNNRPLWSLYEHVAMFVGLFSLALACLLWLPFAMLLYQLLPRQTGQAMGRRVIAWIFAQYLRLLGALCACRFDLSELDALRDAGPLIIAANHPSLLDVVLIVSRLPNAVCVMKSSLMDNPLFGSAARLARYIRNDHALQMIRSSREALGTGAQLVMFPEGTRTRQFPLNPLTPTLAMIARRAGAPVQTVLLEFSSPYLGKEWPVWRKPSLPLYCRARLGRRFDAPTDHAQFTRDLEAYFRLQLPTTHPSAAAIDD